MTILVQIQDFTQRLVAEFSPQRVILFGSYAYGHPTPDSDVDLLVIAPFKGGSGKSGGNAAKSAGLFSIRAARTHS
jgi:predicted nucleotidyltransferase